MGKLYRTIAQEKLHEKLYCGMLVNMSGLNEQDILSLYATFQAPVCDLNCGDHCAPYNERGLPFCCDIDYAIPTAYDCEWQYLQKHTDLWHLWSHASQELNEMIQEQLPVNQVPIECLGFLRCQREYRSITCRAFPFFPYIDQKRRWIGLSYYWEYEDQCWVISHLNLLSATFVQEFLGAFERLFAAEPEEKTSFYAYSARMRRSFGQRHRMVPLIRLNEAGDVETYAVTPANGRLQRVERAELPAFGPYLIAAELPFPDEV